MVTVYMTITMTVESKISKSILKNVRYCLNIAAAPLRVGLFYSLILSPLFAIYNVPATDIKIALSTFGLRYIWARLTCLQ
ncbi:hypothetical protein D3C81_1607160 [compost metagenome]